MKNTVLSNLLERKLRERLKNLLWGEWTMDGTVLNFFWRTIPLLNKEYFSALQLQIEDSKIK